MIRIVFLLFVLTIMCKFSVAQDTLVIDLTQGRKVNTGIGKVSMNPVVNYDLTTIAAISVKYKPEQAGNTVAFMNSKRISSIILPHQKKLMSRELIVRDGKIKEMNDFSILDGFKILFNEQSNLRNLNINKLNGDRSMFLCFASDDNKNGYETSGVTGIPFYDALTLSTNVLLSLKMNILAYYAKCEPTSIDSLKNIYKENPFMAEYVDDLLKKNANNDYRALEPELNSFSQINSTVAAMLSSNALGSTDITTLADGFAKFLVARVKSELSVAFFNKLDTLLKDKKYEDMRTLFPQTYNTLAALGDQIYNYSAYLNSLREAFEMDLNSLLTNLPTVINNAKYEKFFESYPELKAIILSSIYIGKSLIDKSQPGEIINGYDISILNHPSFADISSSIQLFKLFSESLKSVGTDHYWVSLDSVKLLLHDKQATQLYLGLLFQQGSEIKFNNVSLKTILHNIFAPIAGTLDSQKLSNLKSYVTNFANQVSIVTKYQKELRDKLPDKLVFTDYYNYYNSFLTLMDSLVSIDQLIPVPSLHVLPEVKKTLSAFHAGGNIALAINRRNYSSAIVNSFQLYLIISNKVKDNSDYESVYNSASVSGNFLLKYGSFFAAMAQAQNSDEAEKAIESAALPPGSASLKRHSNCDVSLNAYTGLFAGYERIRGLDMEYKFNAYGVSAPIGVALSTSYNGWSFSLFGSFIDLGAITAFRFANDSMAEIPTVQLKDIISPGIFISIGIKGCPISLNAGYQKGANLRKVNESNNDYSDKVYTRFSFALCVDIPIFSLYNNRDE